MLTVDGIEIRFAQEVRPLPEDDPNTAQELKKCRALCPLWFGAFFLTLLATENFSLISEGFKVRTFHDKCELVVIAIFLLYTIYSAHITYKYCKNKYHNLRIFSDTSEQNNDPAVISSPPVAEEVRGDPVSALPLAQIV